MAANPATGPHPVHIANTMAQTHHGQIADYNNNLVSCRSWLTTEWNAFKIKFKKVVEREWNNQMILLPPLDEEDGAKLSDDDFRHLISNPNIPAHVECALDIELMPTAAGSHAQIEVVHLAAPQLPFRNFMHLITNESVELDVRHKDQWPGTRFYHITAAQEVGHWLHDPNAKLYSHIDAAYAKTLPAVQPGDAQYGHVLGKRLAIMGTGNLATEYKAQPWLGRIRRHTGALFGWTMVHRVQFGLHLTDISNRQRHLVGAHP